MVIVLRHTPGEDRWQTAAIVYAPPLLFAFIPALSMFLALVSRRLLPLLTNLVVIGVALTVVAGLQLPGRPPEPASGQRLRVLTWNVRARALQMDEIRAAIQRWDPDIVCVQEVYYRSFKDLLPGYEHHRAGDVRIFSRLPVRRFERVTLGQAAPRRVLVCEVDTAAGPLTLVGLHLARSSERYTPPRDISSLREQILDGIAVREEKFRLLLGIVPDDRPVIVMGDLNTPPASRHYRALAARLTDAFAACGTGFGYTWLWHSRWPVLRIDYVWCGGGVRPVWCATGTSGPSDHRMVVADLLLPAADTMP